MPLRLRLFLGSCCKRFVLVLSEYEAALFQMCSLSLFGSLNASAHTSSQASLDPLSVGSLFASVAGVPRLSSVRLPVGCRGGNLCGFLDHDASMLVKTPSSAATLVEMSSFPLLAHLESVVCSRAWDARATHIPAFAFAHNFWCQTLFIDFRISRTDHRGVLSICVVTKNLLTDVFHINLDF